MTQLTPTQSRELETILAELPAEKVQELFAFARGLRQKDSPEPQRGSAAALLQSLEEVGPLQFEAGELDALLEEIEAMRQLDLADNG